MWFGLEYMLVEFIHIIDLLCSLWYDYKTELKKNISKSRNNQPDLANIYITVENISGRL